MTEPELPIVERLRKPSFADVNSPQDAFTEAADFIRVLYEALKRAETGLRQAKQAEVDNCEEIGYTIEELPPEAFAYLDEPLDIVRTAISRAEGKQEDKGERDGN